MQESVLYAELNEKAGNFDNLIIQNPDYITVKRTVISEDESIFLRADQHLKNVVLKNRDECKKLSPEINKNNE